MDHVKAAILSGIVSGLTSEATENLSRRRANRRGSAEVHVHIHLYDGAKLVPLPLDSGCELEILGRDPRKCDVVFSGDTYVSRVHAAVLRTASGSFVKDLGSTNGTYLNGRLVEGCMPIQARDVLLLGKTTIDYGLGNPLISQQGSELPTAFSRGLGA